VLAGLRSPATGSSCCHPWPSRCSISVAAHPALFRCDRPLSTSRLWPVRPREPRSWVSPGPRVAPRDAPTLFEGILYKSSSLERACLPTRPISPADPCSPSSRTWASCRGREWSEPRSLSVTSWESRRERCPSRWSHGCFRWSRGRSVVAPVTSMLSLPPPPSSLPSLSSSSQASTRSQDPRSPPEADLLPF